MNTINRTGQHIATDEGKPVVLSVLGLPPLARSGPCLLQASEPSVCRQTAEPSAVHVV